jgi:hypothetical protein
MRVIRCIALLGLVFLACSEEDTPSRTMHMTGTVVEKLTGVVIPGASVTLIAIYDGPSFWGGGPSPVEGTTDESTTSSVGAFDVKVTAPENKFERAMVRVVADGYGTYEQEYGYKVSRNELIKLTVSTTASTRSH